MGVHEWCVCENLLRQFHRCGYRCIKSKFQRWNHALDNECFQYAHVFSSVTKNHHRALDSHSTNIDHLHIAKCTSRVSWFLLRFNQSLAVNFNGRKWTHGFGDASYFYWKNSCFVWCLVAFACKQALLFSQYRNLTMDNILKRWNG